MRAKQKAQDEQYKQEHPEEVARDREERRRKLIEEFLPPEEP